VSSVVQWPFFFRSALLAFLRLSFVDLFVIFLRLALELCTFSNLTTEFRVLRHMFTFLRHLSHTSIASVPPDIRLLTETFQMIHERFEGPGIGDVRPSY
jgi:hypothetical protein